MRIVLCRLSIKTLKERIRNEMVILAMAFCVVSFLIVGILGFLDMYDRVHNSEVQQCYEVFKSAAVTGGYDWWENREIRIKTGRHQYYVHYIPYWNRVFDMSDKMNDELRGKRILIQYRDNIWNTRYAMGVEYDGETYIDPKETFAIWERRILVKDILLSIYIFIDLLILIPTTLGIIKIEKKQIDII